MKKSTPRKSTSSRAGKSKRSSTLNSNQSTSVSMEKRLRSGRQALIRWSSTPSFKYIAGGVGLAVLARIAYKMSERYPQISDFFRENLETIEDRLREFKGIAEDRMDMDARH